ncbi:MAG: hypothetical protein A2Y62_02940, partial [Candidatus Fischerbacteria bacterium RBG_13_37_8]
MRKLIIRDSKIMKMAVQQEIKRSPESRYEHRLHGILLICSGMSCYEVARLLGHSARTIQYWVRKFERSGFAGLEEMQRSGRPCVFDDDMRDQIGKDIRTFPRDFGYAQNLWDGKLLSYHLLEKFHISLGVRQCQRLFRQLGFRRRKPRP